MIWPVSRDSWVCRTLDRYAFVGYHCYDCREQYFTRIVFACHLVRDHGVRDPVLLRFIGADSDAVSPDRLEESIRRAKGTPRLS
jgi:hypothetical protein